MFNQWCTIQSDPGVFTQLVKAMGAKSVQVQQIYSLEGDTRFTGNSTKIYGYIFLFKWTKSIQKRQALTIYDKDLFFARQIVNNACATQAILSILLNAPIQIQGNLKDFYQFTKDLTAQDRGLALSNSQSIRLLHNSFSRPEPFIFKQDNKKKKKQADVYHFVSYIPHKGNLYELDGLQPGPILIGKYEGENGWIALAQQQIMQRINKYSQKQIRFNLLVVCEDLKLKALRQIQQLKLKRASIAKKLKILGKNYDNSLIQSYPDAPQTNISDDLLENENIQAQFLISQKQAFCQSEQINSQERKAQNIRRKHNYIPLIIQVLKTLAKKKKITQIIQKANKKP